MTLPPLEEVLARFEPVVGLEVHVQLATRTKAFCGCAVVFGAPSNSRTCPVCAGHPGALPVPNRAMVDLGLRLGLALGAAPQAVSRFDRKSYFYPDLPKGYQITQQAAPLFVGGALAFEFDAAVRRVPLERLHLEEDAGKLVHRPDGTRVDLNRAGVPLAEVVTRPALGSGAEAAAALRALRDLVRWLGVGEAAMAEGGLRCDANVSLRPRGGGAAGDRVEVKNLNSFRFVEQAVDHEVRRQAGLLRSGEAVLRETRGFDEATGTTHPQRAKEGLAEYRYLPEPDLPPLRLDPAQLDRAREALPPLPLAAQADLEAAGVRGDRARALTRERALDRLFRTTREAGSADPDRLAAFLLETVVPEAARQGAGPGDLAPRAEDLAALLARVDDGTLSAASARPVLDRMLIQGESPEAAVAALGLTQLADEAALAPVVAAVLARHPEQVARYREGKTALLGFFMGRVMAETGGRAHPGRTRALLRAALAAPEA